MEALLIQISNYLLSQSWQIIVLVVAVAAVSWLLRNRSAHVRYLLWLVVLAKCLVPPLVTVPLAILPQESIQEPVLTPLTEALISAAEIVNTNEVESPAQNTTSSQVSSRLIISERETRLTIRQWLVIAWIAGVCIFALIVVIKALRTELWLKKRRKPLPSVLQDQIDDIFSRLNIKASPNLWLVDGIGQPFVWGLLRGDIYLPFDFVIVNDTEQRRGIISHELSHITRFDAAVNVVQLIAQAIYWFHPFVWWANQRIRAEREKCCDEMVVAGLGTQAKDYSKAIVEILISEQQQNQPIPSLAVAGPVKNIEERIKTMLRPGKKFYKRPSLIAATTVLLLALMTVPISCVLTNRDESETAISSFEPSITMAIYNIIHPVPNYIDRALDLDKDILLSIPDEHQKPEEPGDNVKWLIDNGGDLVAGFQGEEMGLMGFNMVSETLPARAWDELSGDELLQKVSGKESDPNEMQIMKWNNEGEQPVYAFATKNGSNGLLQMLSVNKKTKKIELRYKKLTNAFLDTKAKVHPEQIPSLSLHQAAGSSKSHVYQYYGEITPDGVIHFKETKTFEKGDNSPRTTFSFTTANKINIKAMYDETGKPLQFTTTSKMDGLFLNYNVILNEPVEPGEKYTFSMEGTMTDAMEKVANMENTFMVRTAMHHHLDGLMTTTYLLPKGAEVISTNPANMKRTKKNGQIELYNEKLIGEGKSISTQFQYKLTK
ncbi:MAG: M56 family metallopeptidase [Sedimentisphaerales bacterium]|nr:M56 family metallopeptidase [Sedimentisphaerales bacterium]